MGNASAGCQGAAEQNARRAPGDPLVLAVVRTAKWGLGTEEDLWQVEVPGTATVAELKAKISELYDVPPAMQKLSLGMGDSDPALADGTIAEELLGKRVFLNPAPIGDLLGGLGAPPEAQAAITNMTNALMGAAQEMQETDQAMRESLEGVTYKVTFERPQAAGGKAAGKKVQLEIAALAQMDTVQQMVEVEMFGAVGAEPAFLVFQGIPLPPFVTPYDAQMDGKAVIVSKERPPNPGEQLLGMLAAAAGGGQAGFMVPPGGANGAGTAPAGTA